MERFSRFHPSVLLTYYLVILIITLSFNNPIISAASLFGALLYSFVSGKQKAQKSIWLSLVIIASVSLFNFVFVHYGEDVLFTVKDVDFTLEALFYGFNQGVVMSSSLLWFAMLSRSVDSRKTAYLFRFSPKLALLFSMVLGLIPRLINKHKDIREARLALCGGEAEAGLKNKMKAAVSDLSALTNYSLEGSIITANSMNAREYNPSAIRFKSFCFFAADAVFLTLLLSLSAFVIFQKIIGNLSFVFEPTIYINRLSIPAVICFAALALLPFLTDLKENLQWKLSKSKA